MRKYVSIVITFIFLVIGCNPKEKYMLTLEEWEAINKYRTFDIEEFNKKQENGYF